MIYNKIIAFILIACFATYAEARVISIDSSIRPDDSALISSGLPGTAIVEKEIDAEHNRGSLTLSSPLDYQVFQRFDRSRGQMSIKGTVEGDIPETIEVKVEDQDGSGQWKRIPATIHGQTFSANMTIPAGGWFKVGVRALDRQRIIAGTEVGHVGIGEVFIVAGQSNSANYGEERQRTKTGLVSVFNGNSWQPANDPEPGADGNMGSFIPPLGDSISLILKVPVGFMACGIGATSVREWLPDDIRFQNPPTLTGRVKQLPAGEWKSDGEAFKKLLTNIKMAGPYGIRAILWHQGESDANQPDPECTLPGYLYWHYLERLIHATRKEAGWDIPWFVAQATYHQPGDEGSPDIRAAQKALWESGVAIEGPDTDELKGDMRENKGQGVHFSNIGLHEHAAKWVEKITPWLDKKLSVSQYNKTLPLPGEIFSVNGHVAFVILPGKLTVNNPWVWYAPVLPGLPGDEENWMFEKFINAGIAVAGVDAGESYGSPDGTALYSDLYKEMTENRGFSSRPVLLGRSRGGLMTLNWAAENPEKTAGFAGIYPVCNLTSYPGVEKAATAYHMTPEELAGKLTEHNPVDRLAALADAKVPMFAIHGDSDKLVPLGENSGKMKKRFEALGGKMQLIVPQGQGHNMWEGFFRCKKLVNYVIRNAKSE